VSSKLTRQLAAEQLIQPLEQHALLPFPQLQTLPWQRQLRTTLIIPA
jgi:hypothetical protein